MIQSATAAICLCLAAGVLQDGGKPKETDTKFENLKSLAALVRKADKVVLHEGLPHQSWERELLAGEKKTKKWVELNAFPFYGEVIEPKEKEGRALTDWFLDPSSFKKYGGPKHCGGFHPDWCIEWTIGKETVRAQICLGCHEMKTFGPDVELHCDFTKEGLEAVKALLGAHRKNRPEAKR